MKHVCSKQKVIGLGQTAQCGVSYLDGSEVWYCEEHSSQNPVEKWDIRFLEMAKLVSRWSKDPSTKCGAVIVRPNNTIASVGFNGFPRGCDDNPALYAVREVKLGRVIHAELNAILSAQEILHGYTIYTWPPMWGPSCQRCAAHIIQSGIKRVVHQQDTSDSKWKESNKAGIALMLEAGIEVVQYGGG